jgi:hypothetical protein
MTRREQVKDKIFGIADKRRSVAASVCVCIYIYIYIYIYMEEKANLFQSLINTFKFIDYGKYIFHMKEVYFLPTQFLMCFV